MFFILSSSPQRPSAPPHPIHLHLLLFFFFYLSAARCGRFLLNDAGGSRQNCNMAEPMARKTQHENILRGLELEEKSRWKLREGGEDGGRGEEGGRTVRGKEKEETLEEKLTALKTRVQRKPAGAAGPVVVWMMVSGPIVTNTVFILQD